MTMYAKTEIECLTEDVEYTVINCETYRISGPPKYRATITVEFDGEIPECILDIMRTGELK